jgi:hypothetical protein
MQRIHRSVVGLCGLSLLLLLGGGCGQDKGERCQVTSDCSSGLECVGGPTGNGTCQLPGTTMQNDAAVARDASSDDASASGPELSPVTPEVGPEATPVDGSEPDADESEAGAIDTGE